MAALSPKGRLDLQLKYPNLEVQASLNESLLQHYAGDLSMPGRQVSRLWEVLEAGHPQPLRGLFHGVGV